MITSKILLALFFMIAGAGLIYKLFLKEKQGAHGNAQNLASLAQINESILGVSYLKIKRVVHESQIDIFDEVLIIALRNLHETLIKTDGRGVGYATLFDFIVDRLYELFKNLSSDPDLYSRQDEKSRNTIITIFCFYRVLLTGLKSGLSNPGLAKKVGQGSSILMQRIPLKVVNYCGAECWRLFEFQKAVEEDFTGLRINADISQFLVRATEGLFQDSLLGEEKQFVDGGAEAAPKASLKTIKIERSGDSGLKQSKPINPLREFLENDD